MSGNQRLKKNLENYLVMSIQVFINMDIKKIIVEELQSLNEGLSDIVYHFTHVGSISNILVTNKINTSSNLGTTADAQKDKGKTFYFSTQRSKGKTGYGYTHGSDAVLVLDGKKLMQRYKGFPTDYWNWSMSRKDYSNQQDYMNALRSKEMEDRIVTDKPYIEPASDYILEIHVDLSRPWYIKKSKAIDIEKFAKHSGIPIYFYDDKNQYQFQNKAKAKPIQNINTEFKSETDEGYESKSNDFYQMFKEFVPYIFYNTRYESEFWQLFKKFLDSQDKLKEFDIYKQEIDNRMEQVSKFYQNERQRNWYYLEDPYRSLMSDFHNKKSSTDPYYREFLRLLVKDMKDFKAQNLKQYLTNKLELKD